MPLEISSFNEFPEWMLDQLRSGEAQMRLAGRPASPEQLRAAAGWPTTETEAQDD